METRGRDLEDVLDAILRGAAKILGCDSTHLILLSESTGQIRIRVGAKATSWPVVNEIEQLLGSSFDGISFPLESARDSMIYASWRDGLIRETSSLQELVGKAFPPELTAQVGEVIGDHRFISVPARGGSTNYGVLLFERPGRHPFSHQQRAVLLRYAPRIGEIVENNLVGQGHTLLAPPSYQGPLHLLLDPEGTVLGTSPATQSARTRQWLEDEALIAAVGEHVRSIATQSPQPSPSSPDHQAQLDDDHGLELFPLVIGGEPRYLAAVRERRRHRTTLENQLLQLTLGAPAPALFVDPRYRITSCNNACEQLFGYQAAELRELPVGRLFRREREILDILSPEILDPSRPYYEESAVILRKDGTLRSTRAQALLLADDVNQLDGYLVVVRPHHESRGQAPDLAQRLATLGEMTAELAHEIRNPLVAIGAALDSLSREELPDDQRAILTTTCQEIARLDAVLQKQMTAHSDLALADVGLEEVVDGAKRLLEAAYDTDHQRIVVEVDPELRVQTDFDALKRLLFNLLLNALEADGSGAPVVCRAETAPRYVSLVVEDRGPGLGAGAEQCFQPFFTTKTDGTGLGLPVCRQIAESLGGVVELHTRRNGGARATVVLPRRTATVKEP